MLVSSIASDKHGVILFHQVALKTTLEIKKLTSPTITGAIVFICEEIGRMLSSSSMTTQALHEATESKKRSLKRPAA